MSIPEFDHISLAHKDEAVRGFVKINPAYAGIDFDTMMEIIIDSDSYLPIIGDVHINEAEATALVRHFIDIALAHDYLDTVDGDDES